MWGAFLYAKEDYFLVMDWRKLVIVPAQFQHESEWGPISQHEQGHLWSGVGDNQFPPTQSLSRPDWKTQFPDLVKVEPKKEDS